MRVNHAKALVEAGRPAIGAWLSLASPLAAEHMAADAPDLLVPAELFQVLVAGKHIVHILNSLMVDDLKDIRKELVYLTREIIF